MNAELHPPRRARRGNQEALIAWLDEQERILRMRGVPAELVQEFDPINNLPEEPPEVEEGRRTLEIKFNRFGGLNLETSIANQINRSIEERVRSRFKLEITSWIQLQNIEDGSTMDWYNTDLEESLGSRRLWRRRNGLVGRRRQDYPTRIAPTPNGHTILPRQFMPRSSWTGILCSSVLGVSLIGFATNMGCCPRTRTITTSVSFAASLCIRAPPPGVTCAKPASLRSPSSPSIQICETRLTDKHLSLLEKHFKQGIAAYTVQPNGDFILTHIPANYDQVGIPLLNMGLYYGHAFLITDLKQVAGTYTCGECQARFTHLVIWRECGKQLQPWSDQNQLSQQPHKGTVFCLRARFLPGTDLQFCCNKVARVEAKNRGIHIHHARCGHGGERKILGARVDGYHQESKTVFQFHGCLWHGCEKCYPEERQKPVQQKTRQGKVIPRLDTEKKPMNRKTAYELTLQRTQSLRKEGYRVVEKWEHEKPTPWANTHCPKVETETYPHAIVYDFESYQDTSKAVRPTSDLFYESEARAYLSFFGGHFEPRA